MTDGRIGGILLHTTSSKLMINFFQCIVAMRLQVGVLHSSDTPLPNAGQNGKLNAMVWNTDGRCYDSIIREQKEDAGAVFVR